MIGARERGIYKTVTYLYIIKYIENLIEMAKEKMQSKDVGVADFAGYLIDFIMKLFSIIFKGKEISRRGAHALALFILTISILYPNTIFPNDIDGFIKIYGVSSIFFSYFLIDALQNFDKINRILRRFQQKTDLAYEDIINNVVTGNQVENLLNTISFNCNQLKNIINHLKANNQFTRLAQHNLLLKSNDFTIDTDDYIQQLLIGDEVNGINEKWDSLAICTYIEIKKSKLSDSFLKKMYERYKDDPSIVFSMGRFQHCPHFVGVGDLNKRLLLAGRKVPSVKLQKVIMNVLRIVIFVILLVPIVQFLPVIEDVEMLYVIGLSVFFVIGNLVLDWLNVELIKMGVKKSMQTQKIDMVIINIDKFMSDIT